MAFQAGSVCRVCWQVLMCVCCAPLFVLCWRVMLCRAVLQAKSANEAQPTIPGQEWRTTIVLLSWITSGLFGVLFLVHLGRIGVSCCRKRRRGHGSEQDLEKAGLAGGRPPSAAVELGKEVANRCVCVCVSRLGAGGFNSLMQAGREPRKRGHPRVRGYRLGCGIRNAGVGQTRRFEQGRACLPCSHAGSCMLPAHAHVLPVLTFAAALLLLLCAHTQALHEQGPVWQREGQGGPGPSAAISRRHIPAGAKHLMSAQWCGSSGSSSREPAAVGTAAGQQPVQGRWRITAAVWRAPAPLAAGVCTRKAAGVAMPAQGEAVPGAVLVGCSHRLPASACCVRVALAAHN